MAFEPIRRNRKYVPNLARQQAESTSNYLLLDRLLGLLDDRRSAVFGLPGQGQFVLTETERSAYTSFITMAPLERVEWLDAPQLDVRMYHDARMAEVASINGYRPTRGSHPRGEIGRQVDEKQQINQHLGEWLRHCLDHGLALGQQQRR